MRDTEDMIDVARSLRPRVPVTAEKCRFLGRARAGPRDLKADENMAIKCIQVTSDGYVRPVLFLLRLAPQSGEALRSPRASLADHDATYARMQIYVV